MPISGTSKTVLTLIYCWLLRIFDNPYKILNFVALAACLHIHHTTVNANIYMAYKTHLDTQTHTLLHFHTWGIEATSTKKTIEIQITHQAAKSNQTKPNQSIKPILCIFRFVVGIDIASQITITITLRTWPPSR